MSKKKIIFILNNCLDIDDNDDITQRFVFLIQHLIRNSHQIILFSYKNINYSQNKEFTKWINNNLLIIEYLPGLEININNLKLSCQNVFDHQLLTLLKSYISNLDLVVLDDLPYRNLLINYLSFHSVPCLVNSLIDIPNYLSYDHFKVFTHLFKNHNHFYSNNLINTSISETYLKSNNISSDIVVWPKIILKDKVESNEDDNQIILNQKKKWNANLDYEYNKFLLCIDNFYFENQIHKVIDIIPSDVSLILLCLKYNDKYLQYIKDVIEFKKNILLFEKKNLDDQNLLSFYLSCDFTITAKTCSLDDIYTNLGYFYGVPTISHPNNGASDFIINNTNGIFLNFNQHKKFQIERLNFSFYRKNRLSGINKIYQDYQDSSNNFYDKFWSDIISPTLQTVVNQKNNIFTINFFKRLYFYFYYLFYINIWSSFLIFKNLMNDYKIYQICFDDNGNQSKYKITNHYNLKFYHILFGSLISSLLSLYLR